ncbi:MAG: hypothetical protein J6M66_13655 [Lachnospiraceae bacterium]|nr:hypothetical protein [Lachnospiraceae bacterium]
MTGNDKIKQAEEKQAFAKQIKKAAKQRAFEFLIKCRHTVMGGLINGFSKKKRKCKYLVHVNGLDLFAQVVEGFIDAGKGHRIGVMAGYLL